MSTSIWAYGNVIALLIGLGAIGLERVAASGNWPRRHVWFLALFASVMVPALMILLPQPKQRPTLSSTVSIEVAPTVPQAAPIAASPAHGAETVVGNIVQSNNWKPLPVPPYVSSHVLITAWFIASAGVLGYYFCAWVMITRRSRSWPLVTLAGHTLLLTDQMGPAVLGFLRPQIIVPRWVLTESASKQVLMLRHEQEHIVAADPLLILGGVLLVAVAPWNIPLWWQLRRLRFAVEVDCDARVLRGGPDARSYGEMLLSVGQHAASTPLGAIALTERPSQLERRVRIMTAHKSRFSALWIAAGLALATACVATAATLNAPSLSTTASGSNAVDSGLRKLPLPADRNEKVAVEIKSAVQRSYPELFSGPKRKGVIKIVLALNADGTIYKIRKKELSSQDPDGIPTTEELEPFGVPADAVDSGGSTSVDSSVYEALYVTFCVIRTEYDWTRSSSFVENEVRRRYGDQFLPRGLGVMNRVTVFMTEAGRIDRARIDPLHHQGLYAIDNPDVERFQKLGYSSDQIGPMGELVLSDEQEADHKHIKYLLVSYAWPRRSHEAAATPAVPPPGTLPGDDPGVDLAIIEKYFPDAFTVSEQQAGLPWVLLARDGSVQLTGRSPVAINNSAAIQAYIEALLPGAKINDFLGTSVRNAAGKSATAQFLWLAPDSPLARSSQVDLAKRKDAFLFVEVAWPKGVDARTSDDSFQKRIPPYIVVTDRGRSTSATWLPATFDEPARVEEPGLPDWRVTARAMNQAEISLAFEVKPQKATSHWVLAGVEESVPYGATTNFQWTNDAGQVWKFAVTPESLNIPVR
jgi:hypothetical protein